METNNEKRSRLLGQPYGTATSKLRKMLLFQSVKMLGADRCYRCENPIVNIDEFSIEHMISWQGAANPREAFFDLSNITYSHLSCNVAASYKPWNKLDDAPEGTLWCSKGKHYQPIEIFHSNASKPNGFSDSCAPCDIKAVDVYRRKKGLRPKEKKFIKNSKYEV
jgi:hypothetical protein